MMKKWRTVLNAVRPFQCWGWKRDERTVMGAPGTGPGPKEMEGVILVEGSRETLSNARPVRAALGRLAERAERFNWADVSYSEAR